MPTSPRAWPARGAHLDRRAGRDVTLIITGGLRMPPDFVKALALGADGVALANSAIQADRVHCGPYLQLEQLPRPASPPRSRSCGGGWTSQRPRGAWRRFWTHPTDLMQVMARACGHHRLSDLQPSDLTTWKREMTDLSGGRLRWTRGERDHVPFRSQVRRLSLGDDESVARMPV